MADQDAGRHSFSIEGRTLGYPTEFRDGCSAGGLFAVRSRVADELIADSGFRVAEIAPGRAILALTCVHYTDSDCGRYEEIAQAFFVEPADGSGGVPYLRTWLDIARGRVASFTWKLQVTTPLSQQAGIRMWGFPKTIEAIDFERSDEEALASLRMDDREALRFSVPARGNRKPASVTTPVYSVFEGVQQVSRLSQVYRDVGYFPGGGRLELGAGPLADALRALGLPRRPLLATWNGHLTFHMSAPRKLRPERRTHNEQNA